MTRRMHYTNDEWMALAQAPTQIALGVMGVGATSPFQVVRELLSVGYALRETSQARGAGELIRELNTETQAQLNELSQQHMETIDLSQARAQALAACRRVAAIVDAREPAADATEYKRWLIWLGQRVA